MADPFMIDSDFDDEEPPSERTDAAAAAAVSAPAAAVAEARPEPSEADELGGGDTDLRAEGQEEPSRAAETRGAGLTDFEKDREARIRRNRDALEALGVAQAAERVADVLQDRQRAGEVVKKPKRKEREPKEKQPGAPGPVKRSRRLAGAAAENDENGGAAPPEPEPEPLEERLLTCEEYCDLKGIPRGHTVDGKFHAWVEGGVCKRIGVAPTAEEHWAKWGSNVQLKPPKGQSAKDFSRTQLKSNPNQYFYRHNEPGEDEWHGEWSEEEIQSFVEVAKTHGCGNKWGLFASYIPHRVGYQCSAAHRNIMLPRGLLLDKNFVMTADGKTRWVGGRGGGDD